MTNNPQILTRDQIKFLDEFSKNKYLREQFYFIPYLKSIKTALKYIGYDMNTSFNRNIILVNFNKYDLKLEFTYFPFTRIDKSNIKKNLMIDSIKDIAVNKLFMINSKYGFTLAELIK